MKPSIFGARRLGFGVDAVKAPVSVADAKGYFLAQLAKSSAFDASDLLTTDAAMDLFVARAAVLKSGGDKAALAKFPTTGQLLERDLELRLARIITSDRPLIERLALYWLNHFMAAIAEQPLGYFLSSFEREAIRPYMLGHFADLLIAATTHPAMLVYLNNRNSIGPHTARGLRGGKGLNENHAREVLELHSLGVNGGYTQADIIELAKALTGWTINIDPHREGSADQRRTFDPSIHEPGARTVMGRRYPDTGREQALDILRDVAMHPATARHVTRRMVAHFVGDSAPPDLDARLARVFLDTGGDLMKVVSALVGDDALWSLPSAKLRPPIEFMAASAQLLGSVPMNPKPLISLKIMGQPYLDAAAPNGWPEGDEAWAAPDAWKSRLDWATQVSSHVERPAAPAELIERAFGDTPSAETRAAVMGGATAAQSLTLLMLSPEFQRR
jgi:uncharacterized protein (DUF1800 family)